MSGQAGRVTVSYETGSSGVHANVTYASYERLKNILSTTYFSRTTAVLETNDGGEITVTLKGIRSVAFRPTKR